MVSDWTIYDYVDDKGNNLIKGQATRHEKAERTKIRRKLDMLATVGPDLGPKLLTDTKSKNIKEIVINGRVAIRILLCRGPNNMQSEHTLLYIAEERDRKYVPENALEIAERHRGDVINDNKKHRCDHERI